MKGKILLIIFLLHSSVYLHAQAPYIILTQFASGFTHPLDIEHCGDSRLFIVEEPGRIYIVDSNGVKNPTPFLNIAFEVNTSDDEQGLLGLAFHPDYKNNGYFYVNYITGAGSGRTRISRFKRDTNNPNHADSTTEVVLLSFPQPYMNHNGGCLKFGPDGYLYDSEGDGGFNNVGDPQNRAQQTDSLFGKILRIDVDHGSPYSIPASNPFAHGGGRPEVWAYGLRNPWRFSFDRLNGDLWIADVGHDSYEEIDFQPANDAGGENYGWRCYEGNHPYPPGQSDCNGSAGLTFPVYEYGHSHLCTSVTGGYVYRGTRHPDMYGKYFFTDYCHGFIQMLEPNGSGGFRFTDLGIFDTLNYSSFGEDVKGELYLAELSKGTIMKIGAAPDGIKAIDGAAQINIFPDPSAGNIKVNGLPLNPGNVTIKIFNTLGELIYTDRKSLMTGSNETSIDISGNPDGVYVLKLINEQGIYSSEFIIQK